MTQTVQVGEFSLVLRDVVPGDAANVVVLHTQVFGPEVDASWFTWKYGQDWAQGLGQAMGVWHAGELIAYCGGVPRTLWRQGQSVHGLQIGDVMVHPQWRGILTRRGPFFHVSKAFYDSRLGSAPNHPFQLGFGFPSERHLRLAVLLGLLQDAGVVESLHWTVAQQPSFRLPWLWHWQELQPSDTRFDSAVNAAWSSMLAQSEGLTLGQRDAAYVRWRFVDRPEAIGALAGGSARYRFFELRRPWSNSPAGVAVLNLKQSGVHWLDWVGATRLMPLACTACKLEAARIGATELIAWASPAAVLQLAHSSIDRREACAGLGMPTSSDLNPEDVPDLGWWLMGGDTDFL